MYVGGIGWRRALGQSLWENMSGMCRWNEVWNRGSKDKLVMGGSGEGGGGRLRSEKGWGTVLDGVQCYRV